MTLAFPRPLLGLAAVLLAACSSTPPAPPAPPAPAPVAAPSVPVAPPKEAVAVAPVAAPALPAYLDPQNPIATERSVYFAFDASTVDAKYGALVERQGRFLAAAPGVSVRIEGSCDERGSREYNLALGNRRAEAFASRLKIYGARAAQLDLVSLGKEKPRAPGHDEAAWAQNRRADIVYPLK